MSRIFIHGLGAVSPAGWGVPALREALRKHEPIPTEALARPGWPEPLHVRPVPRPVQRPAFLAHPRLRRSSMITQHAVGAALEALGSDVARVQSGETRVGIVVCLMSGGVAYSRRFYEEVLNDPSVASPMLFPETVYNAPASHLASYLNSDAVSYSLVGDESAFLQGLAVAAGWLLDRQADGCLVVGAEESDWLVADALRLFSRRNVQGAGAGAIYLRPDEPAAPAAELTRITDAFTFNSSKARRSAATEIRAQLLPNNDGELLCWGGQGIHHRDVDEEAAWRDWTGARLAPKQILGEAFTASAAWQCVAACDAVIGAGFTAANVSVVGASQQAIGARFTRAANDRPK